MLIRSQDKKSLININAVSQFYVDDDNNITADFNNSDDCGFEVVGEYSTEAKAIKVLDAIENAYVSVNSEYRCENDTYWQSIRDANLVFRIPQDSEVVE